MSLDAALNPESTALRAPETDLRSPGELRALLRAQGKATAERAQRTLAESIALCAVDAYWSSLGLGVALRAAPVDGKALSDATRQAAEQFGRAVAKLSAADAAWQLGLLYTTLLPSTWRSTHGVFYTPPPLANRLLDQAEAAGVDWKTARVLDPAAGAGAFLVPAALRMLRAIGPCTPAMAVKNIAARLKGFELDRVSAWMADVFIEAALFRELGACARRPGSFITVCDSLGVKTSEAFDLVIGNPPFGRLRLDEDRRETFARSLYGHANLYGLFMDLAVRLTKPGGVISFLTPSSFLAGEYFKNLRAVLWQEAPPVTVDFVTARKGVFEDVLQETILATYSKGGARSEAAVSFITCSPAAAVVVEQAGAFTLPQDPTAPWLLARHADEAALARSLRSMPERLADWGYTVSTGPLVWNRYKDQLRDRAEPGAVPLVWAESVTSDGRFVLRAEKRNHQPYLKIEAGDDWLVVTKPCVLLQRTTAKEQARRLIAAEMPASFLKRSGGVSVENHLNMLLPTSDKPAVSPAMLAAFLNSEAADRAFRCLSGSVAVSAYELENLPLPSAAALKKLVGPKGTAARVAKAAAELYAKEGGK